MSRFTSRRALAVAVAALVLAVVVPACGHHGAPAASARKPGASTSPSLSLERAWFWAAPGNASAGMPAADADSVAFTVSHHLVVLLDHAGSVQWQVERVGVRDVAPALTRDAVLVPTDDGVVAYDRGTGKQRWSTTVGERANTPVVVGGRAVVTTWEGSLVALDASDGSVAWRAALGGDSLGPAATDGAKTVVASFDSGRVAGVAAYDIATGGRRWVASLPPDGVSAASVVGAVVVVVAADVAAHGLSLDTGAERWRRPLEGAGSPEVQPLALPDGTVVVGHRQGGMVALDGQDGRVLWQASSDGAAVRGGPAGPGQNGWFAMPLDDGRVLLAGAERGPQTRQPSGLGAGAAVGPGGVLVVSSAQGDANGVEAVKGW